MADPAEVAGLGRLADPFEPAGGPSGAGSSPSTEAGKARATGPPRSRRGPAGQAVEQRRPGRRPGSGRSRANSSSPASPVRATVTCRRVSRATCQVGRAELSANGSSNCSARAGRVSHARGSTLNAWCSVPRCLRGQLGVPGLVERRVVEPDRERLHRPVRRPLHQADDDRRVDPAREERPERDVGHHLLADGVGRASRGAARRPRRAAGRPRRSSRGPSSGSSVEPALVPDRVMRGRELVDALEDRRRVGDVAIGQVAVERPAGRAAGGRRLRAGRAAPSARWRRRSAPPSCAVDQRLLAEPVAAQDQACGGGRPRSPARTSRGAATNIAGPFVLVEVDEDLGVARRAEGVPPGFEAVGGGRGSCRSRR